MLKQVFNLLLRKGERVKMPTTTTIKFMCELKNVCEIEDESFKGSNQYSLEGTNFSDFEFFNYYILKGEISNSSHTTLTDMKITKQVEIELILKDHIEINNCREVSYNFCGHIASIIALENANPHYGTTYLDIIWSKWSVEYSNEESKSPMFSMTDSCEIKTIKSISLGQYFQEEIFSTDFIDFFASGLKANDEKSKFMFWFLIIETIEQSAYYTSLYSDDKLFPQAEQENILKNVSEDKKEILSRAMSRATTLNRPEKLKRCLSSLNIIEYTTPNEKKEIDAKVLKRIVEQRNALSHGGSKWDQNLLYNDFFYIVLLIVKTPKIKSILKKSRL